MVSAALVTGNPVVFKPAEQTPGVALRLVEILLDAGLPPGALAFLPGAGHEIGPALVAHRDVSFVTFTGSKAVGLEIVQRAAQPAPGQRHVKRVVAEMGGKNAIVVDADADLDDAVPAIVQSAFGYAGQKCSAASRVVAHGAIFDTLAERLAGATELVPTGPARDPATVIAARGPRPRSTRGGTRIRLLRRADPRFSRRPVRAGRVRRDLRAGVGTDPRVRLR
jgi:RHH-type proline utilization regulon transcriptional repressor/proline dehydrogenase/delta 1-pyrroline-5-carboxylate dehydrogenase